MSDIISMGGRQMTGPKEWPDRMVIGCIDNENPTGYGPWAAACLFIDFENHEELRLCSFWLVLVLVLFLEAGFRTDSPGMEIEPIEPAARKLTRFNQRAGMMALSLLASNVDNPFCRVVTGLARGGDGEVCVPTIESRSKRCPLPLVSRGRCMFMSRGNAPSSRPSQSSL